MRPIIFLSLFFVLTSLKGQDKRAAILTGKTVAEVIKLNETKGKLLFIYFHADWVQPCQWMKSETFRHPELIQFFAENALVLELNIDSRIGNMEKANFSIKSLPTMLLFDASGNQLFRLEEAMEAKNLLSLLKTWNVSENKQSRVGNVTDNRPNGSFQHLQRPPLIPENNPESNERITADYDILISYFHQYELALHYSYQYQQRIDKKVYVLEKPLSNKLNQFQIRIGTFSSQEEARAYLPKLKMLGINGEIIKL